jgi:glycosyltransferase involved in cell wall biosynthesis
VVAVGRLVDKKGFEYLLEAAPAILGQVPDARIVLGGGGPLEGSLRERARRLGIADRVAFTGALSHPDVLRLLAAAEVVVMPSVRDARGNVDGLPVVVLEAMAAARPVVASHVSGMPLAIEDGVSGRLVPERDPAAIAAAVVEILTDPERARRLGAAARRRVEEELNWDAVAGIHDRLYRTAVGAGAAGTPGAAREVEA